LLARPLITRIDRYLFRQLFIALIAVTLGLAALIWLTQSLRFVELVVNHGLSFGVFLHLTGLLIPSFIAVILPITCFVVTQFTFQRLTGDRELTVMRAAGLSPWALSRPALANAFLAMAMSFALNLWIVPDTLKTFREFQWEIRNKVAAFLLQEGVFTQVSDDLTVYVRRREPDGTLRGILVDDARQPNTHATILAESGRVIDSPTGPRVLLYDGSRQEIDKQTGRLNVLTFGQNSVDLARDNKNDQKLGVDSSEVPLDWLLNPAPYVTNPHDVPKWIAEGHKRLATPFTAVSFALIALYTTLQGIFRRHGGVLRPMIAIMSVVGLLAFGLGVGNLAALNNAWLPMLWLQAVGPGVVCAALLFVPQLLVRTPRHARMLETAGT
jgi:lipopolysaccharide export system permease protein